MATRPEKRRVTRDGKTFEQTFHVSTGHGASPRKISGLRAAAAQTAETAGLPETEWVSMRNDHGYGEATRDAVVGSYAELHFGHYQFRQVGPDDVEKEYHDDGTVSGWVVDHDEENRRLTLVGDNGVEREYGYGGGPSGGGRSERVNVRLLVPAEAAQADRDARARADEQRRQDYIRGIPAALDQAEAEQAHAQRRVDVWAEELVENYGRDAAAEMFEDTLANGFEPDSTYDEWGGPADLSEDEMNRREMRDLLHDIYRQAEKASLAHMRAETLRRDGQPHGLAPTPTGEQVTARAVYEGRVRATLA